MCEPLLLANSYTHTLRPVRSRASTLAREPARPYASLLLHVLIGWLLDLRSYFLGYGLTHLAAVFRGGLATWFGMRTNSMGGCPRIARGEPWAGSVTGGEACGYPCLEKEGFTHPPFWRAPCFWGAKNAETARWVNLRALVLKAFSLLRFFVALDKEMTGGFNWSMQHLCSNTEIGG